MNNGSFSEHTTPDANKDATVYLKVVKEGTTFSSFYSYDNETWTPIADPVEMSGLSGDLKIGLYAVDGNRKTGSLPATFEDFTVNGEVIAFAEAPEKEESTSFTVNYGTNAELTLNGEEQTIANLLGTYKQADVANGEALTFDFTPAVGGRIFRAVTVNGGEPELIGEDSYTYTGTMDTLNPTLSFAFETVSKTTLQAVIDYAQARIDAGDVDNLVPAVQEKFQKAFDAAVEVNDDPAATQDEINEAWSNLLDALHYLDFTVGDKTKLEELVAIAETLDEADYTAASWEAFQDALAAAQETVEDENAVQNDIDSAYDALYDAMMDLAGTADRTTLDMVIAEAEAIRAGLDSYLEEGKQEFLDALEAAKAIGNDATQAEVDAAAEALNRAMADLRKAPDREELEALLSRMESKDLSSYTASSAAAFTAAKNNLAAVLAKSDARRKSWRRRRIPRCRRKRTSRKRPRQQLAGFLLQQLQQRQRLWRGWNGNGEPGGQCGAVRCRTDFGPQRYDAPVHPDQRQRVLLQDDGAQRQQCDAELHRGQWQRAQDAVCGEIRK